MIGSIRQHQTSADSARTPYVSPHPAPKGAVREGGVAAQPLVPFVPREYRDLARRDLIAVSASKSPELPFIVDAPLGAPTLESEVELVAAPAADPNVDEISRNFTGVESPFAEENPDGVYDAADFDAERHGASEGAGEMPSITHAPTVGNDLPWIDAFAVDGEEAEETWPMGEAGRRLDELTESLSSLDASRSRRNRASGESAAQVEPSELSIGATADVAGEQNAASLSNAAPMPMWNEDEWIDIMPTSMHDMSLSDMSNAGMNAAANSTSAVDEPDTLAASNADTPLMSFDESAYGGRRGDVTPPNPGAAVTAQALESLAQRIRAGELPVPEVQSDMTEEAVLAGVLASMLGWRQ